MDFDVSEKCECKKINYLISSVELLQTNERVADIGVPDKPLVATKNIPNL